MNTYKCRKHEGQTPLWTIDFTTEERGIISEASRIMGLRKPNFYRNAVLAYSRDIIAKSQASLSPQDMPEREALSCVSEKTEEARR